MRRVILLTTTVALSCSGSVGPTAPTPASGVRTVRPRSQVPPRARRPPPRRPPRPKRWHAQLLGQVQAAPGPPRDSGQITAVVAAGATLVTAARDRAGQGTWLRGWDTRSRKVLWTLRAPARRVSLGLSADGKSMLVTTPAGTNHIYRLGSGTPVAYRKWKRKRGRNKGRTQGLSADGGMLIRGDVRGQVRGYALDKYKMKWLVKGERVVVSVDGKLAAVVHGKSLRLHEAITGRALGAPLQLTEPPVALALGSGQWAAVVSDAGACRLLSASTKPRPVTCLVGMQLTWSPGAALLGITGRGVARIVRASRYEGVTEHKSLFQTSLRMAFVSNTTYVVANETVGRLSFYRLVKR